MEKLARRWEKEADEGELLDEVAYALEGAADELRALLPLEVTDGEARTKPYRCADCDQPHGPFNNIGSGQSNKPEVTYRLVCDRCWGPKPAAPVRVTDEMVEAGAKALGEWGGSAMPGPPLNRELSRACLSAALTQKGEPRACTGCANGCAGCKGKGKPYGEELMRQLRQGQKGDNE
mgnify:CR=1 FL=1